MVGTFRCGSWAVEPATGRIAGPHGAARVRPKAMDVLVALAERGGEVVGKLELIEEVWGDASVTEAVLTNALSELRRAFGQASRQQGPIETIPRRGYRLTPPVLFENRRPDKAHSLAVLPFDDLTPGGGGQALGAMVLDALVTELGRIPQLRVVPVAAVARARRGDPPLDEVGRRLGAERILTGSTVRSGSRLRLNVQLVDLHSERIRWSTSLVAGAVDPIVLQESLSRTLTRELAQVLEVGIEARPPTPAGLDLRTSELFLRGQLLLRSSTCEQLETGISTLREVVRRVPDFAPAFAALARGNYLLASWAVDPGADLPALAEAAAGRAIDLDPELLEGQVWWAMSHGMGRWRPVESLWMLARLVKGHPHDPEARDALAHCLAALGRAPEAIAEERQALLHDPLSPILRTALGFFLRTADRLEEAEAELRGALELHPAWTIAPLELGRILLARGDRQGAAGEIGRVEPQWGRFLEAVARGRRERTARALDQWQRSGSRAAPYWLAERCMWAGDEPRALACLERAWEERQLRLVFVGADPTFRPLRRHPGFQYLLRRLGVGGEAE